MSDLMEEIQIVQLPPLGEKIDAILSDQSSISVIETAPVGKTDLALLAWLLNKAVQKPGKYLWCSTTNISYRRWIAYWLSLGMNKREYVIEKERIVFTKIASEIYFSIHEKLLKHTPSEPISAAVIGDAHNRKGDPSLWITQTIMGPVRIYGHVAGTSHWFYRMCRTAQEAKKKNASSPQSESMIGYHRLTVHDALKAGTVTQRDIDRASSVIPAAQFKQIYECKSEAEQDAQQASQSIRQFCESRLYIRDKSGALVRFVLNPLQQTFMAMRRLEAYKRGRSWQRKFLLLKYRRGGFTTLCQAENYKRVVTIPNSQCVTLAHNADSTKRIFRIAQLYHEKDPKALPGTITGSRLEYDQLNSMFFIGTAGTTGFGRGDTLQRIHGSEVSKWLRGPRQIEAVSDLIAGLSEAASHGEIVLETTADGNEWFAQTYKEAKKGQNDWAPIFVPWFMDPTNKMPCQEEEIRDTLTEEEKEVIERYHLSFEQIQWRRMKMRALKKLFKQEYPEDDETCFLTSGLSFFENEQIIEMLEKIPEYKRPTHNKVGYLVEWEKPEEGEKYCIGVDTSEGILGCDPNGYGVIKRSNGAQVASLHGLYRPDELAAECVAACLKWNGALLGVERNNHGHAVLQKIKQLNPAIARQHDLGGKLYHFKKGRAGWDTNQETRPVMLDQLCEAVQEGFMKVRDRDFLSECLTFKMQDSGNFEADPGCHDDTVMKWAIAWQMRNMRVSRPTVNILGTEEE